jgi:hypothetical protein
MLDIQIVYRNLVLGLGLDARRFCPLFSNPDPQHYYFTLLSHDHIKMYLYFIAMSSPLAIPLIFSLSPWFLRGKFYWFLMIMTLCGIGWSFLWHPDMAWADWDLLGNFVIPANILAGLLLRDFATSLNLKIYKR